MAYVLIAANLFFCAIALVLGPTFSATKNACDFDNPVICHGFYTAAWLVALCAIFCLDLQSGRWSTGRILLAKAAIGLIIPIGFLVVA